jgi:hypothetical protein
MHLGKALLPARRKQNRLFRKTEKVTTFLATGDGAANRLRILHDVYGPSALYLEDDPRASHELTPTKQTEAGSQIWLIGVIVAKFKP